MSLETSIAKRARERGLSCVSRELEISRTSLASYLIGRARAGTRLLIETKATARYGADAFERAEATAHG